MQTQTDKQTATAAPEAPTSDKYLLELEAQAAGCPEYQEKLRVELTIRKWGKTYCDTVRNECFRGDDKRFREHVAEVIGITH